MIILARQKAFKKYWFISAKFQLNTEHQRNFTVKGIWRYVIHIIPEQHLTVIAFALIICPKDERHYYVIERYKEAKTIKSEWKLLQGHLYNHQGYSLLYYLLGASCILLTFLVVFVSHLSKRYKCIAYTASRSLYLSLLAPWHRVYGKWLPPRG